MYERVRKAEIQVHRLEQMASKRKKTMTIRSYQIPRRLRVIAAAIGVAALACAASAQAEPQIKSAVNEANRVTLEGNVRPEVSAANDRGRVADGMRLDGMQLLLQRPAAKEAQFTALIDELHDPSSKLYHQWLTSDDIARRFSTDPQDRKTIENWLTSHGFSVDGESNNGMIIPFSGTAGEIASAFHTEIHNLSVNGVRRFANVSDPQIPAAFAPVVAGVVSLHNFPPQMMHEKPTTEAQRRAAMKGGPRATFTCGSNTCIGVTPSDLATIYNLNPVFNSGVTGKGVSLVVIEDTFVFNKADWTTFRKKLGLASFKDGSFTEVAPSGKVKCATPDVNGAEGEAILDAEWASAAAPNATIKLAACADTSTTFGGLLALENIIDGKSPPPVISMSYGECEAGSGAAANKAFDTIFKQGVAEGVSIFVSSGDNDAAVCDNRGAVPSSSKFGIAVNGWGSSIYDVSVGGTDFADTFEGTTKNYWSAKNSATYGSAKSYVPEIPWNDSCASALTALYAKATGFAGNGQPYGKKGLCNAMVAKGASDDWFLVNIVGGSGGPSACATGKPASGSPQGGSCKGYAKPAWQKGFLGNPGDQVRDLPDVSLFAADPAVWGHTYLFCDSDGQPPGGCSGAPTNWDESGGTSFASPIWAGFQALIVQKQKGKPQGNPNPVLYRLAAKEYGKSGDASCNSTGKKVASSCIFYDVTAGDDDAVCVSGGLDCYDPAGKAGVLSTNKKKYAPAFSTGKGWDFATGIGTVNVANLIKNWP
jgi:subtilase family serine protease